MRDVQLAADAQRPIVSAAHDDGNQSAPGARYFVDASRLDTLLAGRLNSIAVPRRTTALHPAPISRGAVAHEQAQGKTSMAWFIPLADGMTRAGSVVGRYDLRVRTKSLDQFFADTIAMWSELSVRLKAAMRVFAVVARGNFSYHTPATAHMGQAIC